MVAVSRKKQVVLTTYKPVLYWKKESKLDTFLKRIWRGLNGR